MHTYDIYFKIDFTKKLRKCVLRLRLALKFIARKNREIELVSQHCAKH